MHISASVSIPCVSAAVELLSDVVLAQRLVTPATHCLSSGRTGLIYMGSAADMTAISAQLPDHAHILLSQRALGCYLAGPNASLPAVVTDYRCTTDSKVCVMMSDCGKSSMLSNTALHARFSKHHSLTPDISETLTLGAPT